jgi:acrylyl-CoA reductase (NADPH)/3-hydroxypropionyl-CoA dehydratase/3-hydroxypropionyl-CoA synthetase
VYCEETAGRRYSFFAPQVWMRQRRILLPTAEILGTHLCNAYEAQQVTADVAAGRFQLTEPVLAAFDDLPQAHQEMWENRHTGGSYVVNHALPRSGLRSAEELYAAWAAR